MLEAGAVEKSVSVRREKLLSLYGDALGKALEVVDYLQSAIDRLVEVDSLMIDYLVTEEMEAEAEEGRK